MKSDSEWLNEINSELKSVRAGVVVRQKGDRLYLRGTFSPQPNSGKNKPHPHDSEQLIWNPVGKSQFSILARAGGLCPYASWLQPAGFCRPLTTGFRIIAFLISIRYSPHPKPLSQPFDPSASLRTGLAQGERGFKTYLMSPGTAIVPFSSLLIIMLAICNINQSYRASL